MLATRVQEVLGAMAKQWPSMSVTADVWRSARLTTSGYADEADEIWVRLGEQTPGFYYPTTERWYQQDVGVVRTNFQWLIIPAGLDVRANDHVVFSGKSWLVIEAVEVAGIAKLKIDAVKSSFIAPARTLPTYRQMAMGALIS